MFEYIRTHQRLMQLILLILILPSFALFGVDQFKNSSLKETDLATFTGGSVSKKEFDVALREQIDNLRRTYGGKIDVQMFNTPESREALLNQLIERKLVEAQIKSSRLVVSDELLQESILKIPAFLGPDGKFDPAKYQSLLAAQYMSVEQFQQNFRQQISTNHWLSGVQGSNWVPNFVSNKFSELLEQEREISLLNFDAKSFQAQVKITDEKLKAYYESNSKKFEIPEQAKIEYVVLNMDAVGAQIDVTNDEIAKFYESNKSRFGTEEQRRASHILIAAGKSASEAEVAKAKAKAETVLAEVQKQPSNFSKLAAQYSDDPGSKEKGGDLDFFGRNTMVKPFEEAAYALKEGEVSKLVKSDFGFHIIQLTAIRPAAIKPLTEVSAEIAAEIRKQKGGKAFADAAEAFSNLAESSDNLKPLVEKFKLPLQTESNLTRNGNPLSVAKDIVNNPKLLKAIFTDNVLKKKLNTEAVEVAANTLVAAHLVEFKPASKRSFDEVKSSINEVLVQEEARVLAEKAGEAKLAELKKKADANGFASAKMISRAKPEGLSPDALKAVYQADARALPAFVGVKADNGYQIYLVSKVKQGEPDVAQRSQVAQQYLQAQSDQSLMSYLEHLKTASKLKINKEALNKKTESDSE